MRSGPAATSVVSIGAWPIETTLVAPKGWQRCQSSTPRRLAPDFLPEPPLTFARSPRPPHIRRYDAPLTSSTDPLAITASGDARYTTAAATSSGVATRPSGLSARRASPSLAGELLGRHVGLGESRSDRRDRDPVRPERAGERLAEGDQAGLAGSVGRGLRLPAERAARGHVDDVAAAAAHHVLHRAPGHVRRAGEVDAERLLPAALPLLVGGLGDRVRLEDPPRC